MPPDLPPPSYFHRSTPVMSTATWLKDLTKARAPLLAALTLTAATTAGLTLALIPTCPVQRPAPHATSTGP
ncbi:hypothetical protein [Sphaerisporangium rubeum]|uniref:Uncharacterized protein n=1 Tax=Sphaerisporangium rubeum TaxID=321317 RepID=A0A7X0I8N2_9ACTN|nr:hypothetical protein [Sphaerisporangium rubeum]MBB6470666.1 hypothetical protein [Sphaerisporangium rubeum]